jgi:hypothetical protein
LPSHAKKVMSTIDGEIWALIECQRKACTKFYWFVQDLETKRQSGLSIGIVPSTRCCTWCIQRISDEEMSASTWRTSPTGRFGYEQRPYISRIPYQAIEDIQKSHLKHEHSDVQGLMEPPHRRSHLEKKRRTEGRIPKLLWWVIWILRARFLLRGVGLSHPDKSNLKKI